VRSIDDPTPNLKIPVINNGPLIAFGIMMRRMETASVLNQRRYRERQRSPARVVVRIEIDRDSAIEALIRSGRLLEAECWRRDRLEHALSLVMHEALDNLETRR
jgi:hypothetical protein